ncbi:hypothetical protein ABZU45_40135 [Streptomyces avermitilis]|uniref:hypothetical protein n=1 Tax=Streptomyces avermitilis TaxID=33903 RepID=UPI0033BEE8AE
MQLQPLLDEYVAGARTWMGRAWHRRQTRVLTQKVHEALWFTTRMQAFGELFWPERRGTWVYHRGEPSAMAAMGRMLATWG